MGNLETLCQGAVSSNFRLAGPEQTYDDYRLCALGLVSEYLIPDLATALQVSPEELTFDPFFLLFFRKDWALTHFSSFFQERLGIEEKKASIGQFKRQSVGGQGDGPKPKKAKQEGHEYCMLLFGWLSFNNCNSPPSHSMMVGSLQALLRTIQRRP